MKSNTPELLKFKRLQRRLGESMRGVAGLLELLWIGTAKNAPRGDIGKFTNEEIAIMADWDSDPDALVNALVECGWLDQHPDCRLVVHDWAEHAPKYVKGNVTQHMGGFIKFKPAANPDHQSGANESAYDPIPHQSVEVNGGALESTTPRPAEVNEGASSGHAYHRCEVNESAFLEGSNQAKSSLGDAPQGTVPREAPLGPSPTDSPSKPSQVKSSQVSIKSASGERTSSDALFDEFWEAFPKLRRQKKRAARAKWDVVTKSVDPHVLIERVRAYASSPLGKSPFACLPTTWLNSGMWEDDPAAWQTTGSQRPLSSAIVGAPSDPRSTCVIPDAAETRRLLSAPQTLAPPRVRSRA